jgi:molybdenum cofactor cytidylyltransferase
MIAAIILAAGKSERMGRPKALLDYGGKSFLAHLIDVLGQTKVDLLRVVLGHRPEEILAEVEIPSAEVVINLEFELGMLSSLQAGIRSLAGLAVEAALVCPVDHPAVTPALVDQLIDAYRSSGRGIVIPVAGERRGHPVLFAACFFGELLRAPLEVGARHLVGSRPEEVFEVQTGDLGVLADIDTPEDYTRLTGHDPEEK